MYIINDDVYQIFSCFVVAEQYTHITMEEHIEILYTDCCTFPKFHSPCTTMVSGVSGSGKTTLVHRLLINADELFDTPVHKVLYCMSVHQPLFDKMEQTVPGISFHRGLPSEEDIEFFTDGTKHCIIVLDDLMHQVVGSVKMQDLFTKISHHKSISVVFLVQNLFIQGKCARNLAVNTHYQVIMSNPRDLGQINTLARQTGLGDKLKDSFNDRVMSRPFGYIVVSLHPADIGRYAYSDSPRLRSRIHTNIFPGEFLISYL